MMRKITLALLISFGVVLVFASCSKNDDFNYGEGKTNENNNETEKPIEPYSNIVVAYVTSWSKIIPDPSLMTHINYAFGHVNETFNGVKIDNEERLKTIVRLKVQNPKLRVLLSIGGWGSGRFSEMAASENNRTKFAEDCNRVIKQFGLDGIDIDWEYPTNNIAGISSSPKDTENYNLLMTEIRNKIGKNKFLTFASGAHAYYYDFNKLKDIVDYVNIMMYDTDIPPNHHSALFRSENVNNLSAEESINAHIAAGFPIEKLVLGIPFYGRAITPIKDFITYNEIKELDKYAEKWDDIAKVPYLTDSSDKIICTFDNPASIQLKAQYVKQRKMCGLMYWDYSGDDTEGSLRKAVWEGMSE